MHTAYMSSQVSCIGKKKKLNHYLNKNYPQQMADMCQLDTEKHEIGKLALIYHV